ncbi:DUF6188 family protein [Catellatospora sp. NPDC049609]|uniref:DUF6188 family protein n=1 Tax=Catellatospora sp. NPDC049609 TaxID=3155505 RepID=UPI00343BDCA2
MKVPVELIACRVDRIAFDHQVRISVSGKGHDDEGGSPYRVDAELVIETPFLLRDADGEWHELDPGTGSALAPVLDLFQGTIAAVEVDDRGALHLRLRRHLRNLCQPGRRVRVLAPERIRHRPHHRRSRRRDPLGTARTRNDHPDMTR